MTHCELCKRPKSVNPDKWFMHKPETVLENKNQDLILWDFEIKMYHPILTRKPDLGQVVDFVLPINHLVRIEKNKKLDK